MKEIRQILTALEAVDWSAGEQAALATVVDVEQSSYRRVGARMLVTSSGRWVGGISGGCLEGDALRRAQESILKQRPSLVVYDTREEEDRAIGVGLGCNGRIQVLFCPLKPGDANNPTAVLSAHLGIREPALLLQVIGEAGLPSNLDGRLYTTKDLLALSTNYRLPLESLEQATRDVWALGKSTPLLLTNQEGIDISLICEYLKPRLRLVVFGDNYDVLSMGQMAEMLGWELILVGKKRKFGKEHYRLAARVFDFGEEEAWLPLLDPCSCVVIMTHDYQADFRALRSLLPLSLPYVALLGPAKRRDKLRAALEKDGLFTADYPQLFAPAGLDIGAESPEEIALAIAAEIVAAMRDRTGIFLRNRPGAIHEKVDTWTLGRIQIPDENQ